MDEYLLESRVMDELHSHIWRMNSSHSFVLLAKSIPFRVAESLPRQNYPMIPLKTHRRPPSSSVFEWFEQCDFEEFESNSSAVSTTRTTDSHSLLPTAHFQQDLLQPCCLRSLEQTPTHNIRNPRSFVAVKLRDRSGEVEYRKEHKEYEGNLEETRREMIESHRLHWKKTIQGSPESRCRAMFIRRENQNETSLSFVESL